MCHSRCKPSRRLLGQHIVAELLSAYRRPNAIARGVGFHGLAVNAIPQRFLPVKLMPRRGRLATAAEMQGIYVSTFLGSDLYGFPKNNRGNGPPICTVSPTASVNGFGVDNAGNLIVPNGDEVSGGYDVNVYGPSMCGPLLGTIIDPYGQPGDASAISATTGNIAVGNIFVPSAYGSVSVCRLTSGACSTNLTNPAIDQVGGVGMAPNGDCWADASKRGSSGVAVLVYFAGCSGAGEVATGFDNRFYGSVNIDGKGNLVTTSLFGPSYSVPSVVYVYKGCNPACTLISSSNLAGESIGGHLDKRSSRYVTVDLESADVEVYRYRSSGLRLKYSFTGGIPCATDQCITAAYSPSSSKK